MSHSVLGRRARKGIAESDQSEAGMIEDFKTNVLLIGSIVALAAVAALFGQTANEPAQAQTEERRAAAIPGLSRQPSAAARAAVLDLTDTVVLLLDHQTGLFQTIKDVPIRDLRANTVV